VRPQCSDAVVGRQEGHHQSVKTAERWGAGVVICLEQGADLHTAQLIYYVCSKVDVSQLSVYLSNNNNRFTAVIQVNLR